MGDGVLVGPDHKSAAFVLEAEDETVGNGFIWRQTGRLDQCIPLRR